MNMTANKYYKASGRVSVTAPLRLLWPGAVPTAILAGIYTLVIRYNPFIYFSFIATLIFGVGLAVIASMATEAGKSRSVYFDLFATAVLVLFGLWVHWLSWIMLTLDGGTHLAGQLVLAGPAAWVDALQELAQHYHLTVSRRVYTHGAEMSSDNMLWLWGVEAAVIALLALVCCKLMNVGRVYCEQSGEWAQTDLQIEVGNPDLSPDQLRLALEQNNTAALEKLEQIRAEEFRDQPQWKSLKLELRSAAGGASTCVINAEAVDNTWNAKGERKQLSTTIVRNLLLPSASYQALLARLRLAETDKPKTAAAALPRIGADQKYGLELAQRFAEWLAVNQRFYISHRDASYMGFELMPDGCILYRQYDDGIPRDEPDKRFATADEFVQWLERQSDRILAAESAGRTNPVTHERIQAALTGQVAHWGY
ncbi:hypothetical protein [Paraherbaspirillum soli]|uniref:DUF308 domain-containing protein n=1 Tax=Paraherbaspirillum soli TaxID=631222 RepID=A0ABW0MBA8_9BURK